MEKDFKEDWNLSGMHPYELHRFILSEIPLLDNKIVLDLGCGRGIWGYLMRSERMGDNAYLIGIDLYKPYLQFCKKYQVYDNILIADVRFLPFKDKSVDVVLAIEIIEHLEKDEGYKFIDNSGVRYFFTPISFVFPRISEGLISYKLLNKK